MSDITDIKADVDAHLWYRNTGVAAICSGTIEKDQLVSEAIGEERTFQGHFRWGWTVKGDFGCGTLGEGWFRLCDVIMWEAILDLGQWVK
jgi:hypothetical protein